MVKLRFPYEIPSGLDTAFEKRDLFKYLGGEGGKISGAFGFSLFEYLNGCGYVTTRNPYKPEQVRHGLISMSYKMEP